MNPLIPANCKEDIHLLRRFRFEVILLLLLGQTLLGCATGKIVGNQFINENSGFEFTLPGGEWRVDKSAWTRARDFGYITYWTREEVEYYPQIRKDGTVDIEKVFIPPKLKEKALFRVEIGFRHQTSPMNIVWASITEGDLLRHQLWGKPHSLIGSKENLIVRYFELFLVYRGYQKDPSFKIDTEPVPGLGNLLRMKAKTAQYQYTMYGMVIKDRLLFVLLQGETAVPQAVFAKGEETLDWMVKKNLKFR